MMTAAKQNRSAPGILYSCYAHRNREGEQFIPEHVFGYTISGSSALCLGGESFVFKEGDFRFIRKNQLARYVKLPPPGGEYRSVTITMDQETLRSISKTYGLEASGPGQAIRAVSLQPNKLFHNYMASLSPYLHRPDTLNPALIDLKVKEAVMILLETNPALKEVLLDFSEPGKIDLEAYMNEHYKFSVELSRFAYLTGRSLATFKRDFEKIFHMSPSRWLQQKRLSEAHYLIREKGWKTSDVYLEVGFKDFSHFSYAFKKTYGVSPSRLAFTS
jgi:AraC-like DNA-binding protein